MKKVLSLLLCLILCLSTLGACAQPGNDASQTPAPNSVQPAASLAAPATSLDQTTEGTWSFTDSAGREVDVPEHITRVAPSGATAQMLLLALAPDMMVSLASKFSEEAQEFLGDEYYNLPVIGQFYGSADLNLEEVAALDPQLVIDLGDTKESIVEDMDNISGSIGVPAVHIEATTYTMGTAFRTLGKVLGREAEAEVLANYCETTLADIEDIMEQVGDERVRLLYCVGDTGLSVIPTGSFQGELLNLVSDNQAVVENPSSKGTGNEVDMEQILQWDPDWILFAPDSIYDTVLEEPAWRELTAIKSGNFYKVPFGPYNWMGFPPSVNRYLGMLWTVKLFYPDHADYDLYEKVEEYFDLFYHSAITPEQFGRLTQDSLPQ